MPPISILGEQSTVENLQWAKNLIDQITLEEKGFLEEALALHEFPYMDDEIYTQHAPEIAKTQYMTLSTEDKKYIQRMFSYLPHGIDVRINGTVLMFEKENLTVQEKDLQQNRIVQKNGETYFAWDAMDAYTKSKDIFIPTKEMYTALICAMPIGDAKVSSKGKIIICEAAEDLFFLLGGNFSGIMSADDQHSRSFCTRPETDGGFRTSSACKEGEESRPEEKAWVLTSQGKRHGSPDDRMELSKDRKFLLYPVRALRRRPNRPTTT